jgi:2-polyprenyl-3-methyl-5-hydroxy-6-metoxy-1,4-benzoquinol methylase
VTTRKEYVIRGGVEGRERLRVLGRVVYPGTASFLDRLGVRPGMSCLDVGCGGGDVTVELARRVAPEGRVIGVDLDETTLELARREAEAAEVDNVEFRSLDVREQQCGSGFDLVYARFLITHLRDPESTTARFLEHLRPGGLLAVEDIDFGGSFAWPESEAFRRYGKLYCEVVRRRGGDPNIGRRLPSILRAGGVENVEMNVVQPMGTEGEVKLIDPITMESIADSVLEEGLATQAEIEEIVEALYRVAADPGTVAALPRIVQVWGRRPAS